MMSPVNVWLCNLWYFKSNATKQKFATASVASQRTTQQNVIIILQKPRNVWNFGKTDEKSFYFVRKRQNVIIILIIRIPAQQFCIHYTTTEINSPFCKAFNKTSTPYHHRTPEKLWIPLILFKYVSFVWNFKQSWPPSIAWLPPHPAENTIKGSKMYSITDCTAPFCHSAFVHSACVKFTTHRGIFLII